MKRPYVICAPRYGKSAGVRVLYRLCVELENLGFDACVLAYGRRYRGDDIPKCRIVKRFTDEMRRDSVVVYPETVWGNPLRAHRVARWVLNKPGVQGGEEHFSENELVFSWSSKYHPSPHQLRLDVIDRDIFRDTGDVRTTDAVFVYKGGYVRETPELRGLPVITMDYPADRKELAALLRRTRVLYTHDLHTVLAEEAMACGAQVRVVTSNGFDIWRPSSESYDPAVSARQLAEFVRLTQSDEGLPGNSAQDVVRRPFLLVSYIKWCCARLMQLLHVGKVADRMRMRAVQDIFLR